MMNPPQWVLDVADAFWQMAGTLEPFPRTLYRTITRTLPLGIVLVPNLTLHSVRVRLQRYQPNLLEQQADRPLRACLFVRAETGFIFLDGTVAEDEQRFSLAHELAHYLRDYWQPRRLALKQLGEKITEVLDGQRAPTPSERLQTILQRVPLGHHLHTMRRPSSCLPLEVAQIEEEADQLAFELLAPAQAVGQGWQEDDESAQIVARLQSTFGLPARQAHIYTSL